MSLRKGIGFCQQSENNFFKLRYIQVVEKDRFELPNQKELSYSQPRLATSLLLQFLKKTGV